jgi:uncharacterized protein (TIGR03435 family)
MTSYEKYRRACAAVALVAISLPLVAQSPAIALDPNLSFEVASIRRNTSVETGAEMRIEPSGQVTIRNYTLFHIVRNAYGVQPFQIVPGTGMADWFDRDRWDIIARPPAGDVNEAQRISMLQNLLAARYRAVVKRETRELPVYALVLARPDGRLGPQLRPSSGECDAARAARANGAAPPTIERGFCGTRAGAGNVSTSSVPLADFARNLAPLTGRFVVDRTGLSGRFDLDLKWTPDQGAGAPNSPQTDGTSLFAALEEQLGLRLNAQRAPVDVIVVESAERPVED